MIDAAPVDGRRRLVLVRRDNVEHLLMIGGPSDVVVEQNIVRAVPVNRAARRAGAAPDGSRGPLADAARARRSMKAAGAARNAARAAYPRARSRPRARRAPEPLARCEPLPAEHRDRADREPVPRARDPRAAAREHPRARPAADRAGRRAGRDRPDAALANMAQRLEAALRRPGAPEPRSHAAAGRATGGVRAASRRRPRRTNLRRTPEPKPAPKSKSVLDSLEEEMASLLGRPPEKQ